MPKIDIRRVQALIESSTLISEEKKPELKQFVEGLNEEELKRVEEYLNRENDIIISAFERTMQSLDEPVLQAFIKDLSHLLPTLKRQVQKGVETDTHQSEGEEAEALLKNLDSAK